jgi:hypothetical protein
MDGSFHEKGSSSFSGDSAPSFGWSLQHGRMSIPGIEPPPHDSLAAGSPSMSHVLLGRPIPARLKKEPSPPGSASPPWPHPSRRGGLGALSARRHAQQRFGSPCAQRDGLASPHAADRATADDHGAGGLPRLSGAASPAHSPAPVPAVQRPRGSSSPLLAAPQPLDASDVGQRHAGQCHAGRPVPIVKGTVVHSARCAGCPRVLRLAVSDRQTDSDGIRPAVNGSSAPALQCARCRHRFVRQPRIPMRQLCAVVVMRPLRLRGALALLLGPGCVSSAAQRAFQRSPWLPGAQTRAPSHPRQGTRRIGRRSW